MTVTDPAPSGTSTDPLVTDAALYRLVFENERVRVIEYRDRPGEATSRHAHPDSVMVTLSGFSRRLRSGSHEVDVTLEAGATRWLDAQTHAGTNIGTTPTHALFIELKESAPARDRPEPPLPFTPAG